MTMEKLGYLSNLSHERPVLTGLQLSNEYADCQMPIDGTQGCLRAFAQLKVQYTHLKLILSVGGAGSNAAAFAAMAADSSKRNIFASSCRGLLDQYSFDGIDSMISH